MQSARIYKRNIELLLHDCVCRGKAINVTYSGCVCVASVIQHTEHILHYTAICGLSDSALSFHII
jgi:hypothetical protein